MRELKAILFDFDYTLADSSRGVIACANGALAAMGFPGRNDEEIRRTIGLSLHDTYRRLTGRSSTEEADTFKRTFLERAHAVMPDLTELLPDVADVLADLRRRNIRLAIVSTKIGTSIRRTLEREGLLQAFEIIVAGDDVNRGKPDPEGTTKALALMRTDPHECSFVGDSLVDLQTARNAGVSFVAVLTGTTAKSDFIDAGAEKIINRLEELLS